MANNDQSQYTLRYNEISGVLEAQIGLTWIPLDLSGQDTGITQLTGQVTAGPGSGSQAATITNSAVIAKVLTGYVSGAGTVASTDTILQGIQKLNGNDALALPKTGGVMTGALTFTGTTFALTPPILTTTQRDALTATEGMFIYNFTTHKLNIRTVAAWEEVTSA